MQEFIELLDKSEGCLVNIGDVCTTIELGGKTYSCENIEDSIDGLEKYHNKKVKAFIWKNTTAKLSNIELWVEKIADIMREQDCLLYYEEINAQYQGNSTKFLMNSGLACMEGVCQPGMDNLFEKYNLQEKQNYDVKNEEKLEKDEFSGTTVTGYLTWLEKSIWKNNKVNEFIRVYSYDKQKENQDSEENHPFLTVVTRTQGRRPEALRETLLSLAAQTDGDFEVLIMGHKLNQEQRELVETIIDETESELRKKIRLVPVEYGGRTTPINEAFRQAKGQYAAILDDDDIVFDNWVEEFKKKAEEAPGAVLHAYVIMQDWMTVKTKEGDEALRACGSPSKVYCKKFNWLSQVYANACPPVGLAFPVYAFQKWGIEFDEELDTTEDWDYLMRVGFLCGVADITTPTCIYRWWVNAESSQTVHSKELWAKNHKKIQKKFESVPIVFPEGYSKKIDTFIRSKGSIVDGSDDGIFYGEECPLYVDLGTGFSEKNVLKENGVVEQNNFTYLYELPQENIYSLRWDPTENKDKMVENLQVILKDENGDSTKVSQIYTNGIKLGGKICFLKNDPQIYFKVDKNKKYKSVCITGTIHGEIPDTIIDALTRNKTKAYAKKALKKVYHMVRK